MKTEQKKTPFARFLSSVEGHLVSRYGSASKQSAAALIGATRVEGGGVIWHPEVVVALTEQEADRYKREYDQAVAEGALVERTEAEWLTYRDDAKAAAKKATEEAAAQDPNALGGADGSSAPLRTPSSPPTRSGSSK